MAKYILTGETTNAVVTCKDGKTAEQMLRLMQTEFPNAGWLTCQKIPKGSHACPYCGGIAEGTHEDLLCGECRETFGHSLISEL